ncbi:hypothetical protein GGS23DRAFT_578091 [Durotheca rogersii]|uniref:uncharacterized protein n=1 Tax=Durotheca rogersii TaxID=419775 RepID=UPI00221E5724|nr:uncharacterized protein GGS23DRAFT_578091 [Durotheca rogersii]KAI5860950.1 hypothetical protein GGS23DRAFT_578091 [Durotheca rogersii]
MPIRGSSRLYRKIWMAQGGQPSLSVPEHCAPLASPVKGTHRAAVGFQAPTTSTPARTTLVERCCGGDGDDAESSYDDDDGTTGAGRPPEPEPSASQNGMCSPGAYAEFATNPYSCIDTVAGSENAGSPLNSSGNREDPGARAASGVAHNRPVYHHSTALPCGQSVDETLALMSSHLSQAHRRMRAEDSAALLFLRQLCP